MPYDPSPDDEEQRHYRKMLPELAKLPSDWMIMADPATNRIYYKKNRETTFHHPTLGRLPDGWQVKLCTNEHSGEREPIFFHKIKKTSTLRDPRYLAESIRANDQALQQIHGSINPKEKTGLQIAGSIRKLRPGQDLNDLERASIGTVNIQDKYECLHAIDMGEIGGMNGGVFIVRQKGLGTLFVEKRFKESDLEIAEKEIRILHRVKHSALTFFINGFINKTSATIWMEFCDRGSLKDIIKAYDIKRRETKDGFEKPHMPEKFLWHCFVGLCDALAYLRTGLSFVNKDIKDPYQIAPGWIPVIHRDIKPDNILLRSRATSGARNYFYVALSDFGLAAEEYPPGHPEENYIGKDGSTLGTGGWLAPELCYEPYPANMRAAKTFPNRRGHTEKSDLWALATIIYCMAECCNTAHLYMERYGKDIPGEVFFFSRAAHRKNKVIKTYYSEALRESIIEATESDPNQRPRPAKFIILLQRRCKVDAGFRDVQPKDGSEHLPDWATRVHDYHARVPRRTEDFMKKK